MDEVSNPMFATSIGLLYEGLRNIKPKIAAPKFNKLDVFNLDESMEEPVVEDEKVYAKKENWFGRTINKGYTSVREFFEASPDSEF